LPEHKAVFRRQKEISMNMRKMLISSVGCLVPLVLLLSCTTASPNGDYSDTLSPDAQLFGDYLAGSYANHLDDAKARSTYYSKAYARAQEDINLGRRAVTSALTAGEIDLARTLAIEVLSQEPDEPMSRAVLGAREFSAGRYDKALKYLEDPTEDLTVDIVMKLLKGWVEVAKNDNEAARDSFAALGGGGYFNALSTLQTAKLDALQGQTDDAIENFDILEEAQISGIETALSKARALSQAGKDDEALSFLQAFSGDNGGFESGPVKTYLDRLNAGAPIGEVLSPQQEAARALTEPAFGFFARNRAFDAAEVFLRLALTLDPSHDKAALWLGSLLENSDRPDAAMEIYQSINEGSPYIVSSQLSIANIHFDRDEDKSALDVLERTHAKYPSFVTREALGRARLVREKYAEALPIYDALIASLSEEELENNYQPIYFRGICYERTKQWDLAVADFQRVLRYNPDDADALNYLGYTWVDRGENLNEAFDMIRKAVELEPQSGAIVDSLGWAHYKLGQYDKAKINLEDAVELSPSSATIIDHLGDVYWKLGRFREAGYQWERALEFDPTDEERTQIEIKLQKGLDAVKSLP